MLPAVINERRKLSIGAPPAQRVFGAVFGALFAAAGAAFALLPLVVDGWLQNAFGADESCPTSAEISQASRRTCCPRRSASASPTAAGSTAAPASARCG